MTLPPPRSTLFPYTTLFRSIEDFHDYEDEEHSEQDSKLDDYDDAEDDDEDDELDIIILVVVFGIVVVVRSEEHTSELQSRGHLVCRLLLEKKKKICKLYRSE